MHRQLTTVLVFLLIVLTSAAPLIVQEIQKPPSKQTASTSTMSRSDDSQTASFNVPLPTIHKQAQKLSLKLNEFNYDPLADLPFIHNVIPSANRDLPTVHNKHNPPMILIVPLASRNVMLQTYHHLMRVECHSYIVQNHQSTLTSPMPD